MLDDMRHFYALACIALIAGCAEKPTKNASDAGPSADADGNLDSSSGGADAVSPQPDGGMTDTAQDARPDAAPPSCEGQFPLSPEACNPTENGKCPQDGFCTFAVVGAPPPQLACVPRDKEGTGRAGEPCTGVSDCREGTTCVDWTGEIDPRERECTTFCEIETGRGCADGEFCTKADSLPAADGIGVCTASCDPYDAPTCEPAQTCAPDYQYPANTCSPNFRCVDSTAANLEGDACGPAAGLGRCSPGLTCYETGPSQYRCVKPCRADDDCAGGACGAATGPWRLRYCG